jgi:hypothetical protein
LPRGRGGALLSTLEIAPTGVARARRAPRRGRRAVLADIPGAGALEQALYVETHRLLPDGLLI